MRNEVISDLADRAVTAMNAREDATAEEILSAVLTLTDRVIVAAMSFGDDETREHNRRAVRDVLYRFLAQTADTNRKPS
jgi:hypothetical protein